MNVSCALVGLKNDLKIDGLIRSVEKVIVLRMGRRRFAHNAFDDWNTDT